MSRKKNIVEIEYDGLPSSRHEVISKAFTQYYSSLFRRQQHGSDSQPEEYLEGMTRLSDEIRKRLEEPISVAEIERAINELGPNKSPGPDGLTAALYKTQKHVIAGCLFAVIIKAFETKKVTVFFFNSYTVLIPKVDDEQSLKNIRNYRPIALSNVDYKILMKVLARWV